MEKEKKFLTEKELPIKRSHSPEEKSNSEEPSSISEKEEAVQSANNWERVELGDEGRKAKFLRLMGAAKKEHKGRFVIGTPAVVSKPHGRSSEEERKLEEKLETQFQHSLSDRLHHGRKKHRGLGFDGETSANEACDAEKDETEAVDRSADDK